jgi:hypothetical protein
MTKDWWGFETQLKTWVYLDRTITNNQPQYTRIPLMFVNCKKEQAFEVNRSDWDEPRFIFEGRVPALLPNESLGVLCEFKDKVDAYKALIKPYKLNPNRQTENILDDFAFQSESLSLHTRKLSQEQIRKRYAREYSDEAWSQIMSYVALMNDLGIRDQGKCNEHITRANLWHIFPNIRAMNDLGFGREIEGITRTAYRLVCELINLQNNFGAPLLHSRKY